MQSTILLVTPGTLILPSGTTINTTGKSGRRKESEHDSQTHLLYGARAPLTELGSHVNSPETVPCHARYDNKLYELSWLCRLSTMEFWCERSRLCDKRTNEWRERYILRRVYL